MTKTEAQQLDQFGSTNFSLTNFETIWNLPAFSKFVNNVEEFRFSYSEIIRYKQMQVTDSGGAKDFADQARIIMAQKSMKVRSAVQNFASDTDNTLLYQQVRFPESKLLQGGIQKSLSYANTIEAKARALANELLPYNLTLAEIDEYKLSIVTFENAHSQTGQIKRDRKNATAQLKILFPATRKIVETKLRKGATQFMVIAYDFYKDLLASFEIKKYPTHYTEFDIVAKDKTTGQALGGVKITAQSEKGIMEQFTNPVGETDFKQFEPSWWTLTYECPGFEKLIMPAIKTERGTKHVLVAEMEKIVHLDLMG